MQFGALGKPAGAQSLDPGIDPVVSTPRTSVDGDREPEKLGEQPSSDCAEKSVPAGPHDDKRSVRVEGV